MAVIYKGLEKLNQSLFQVFLQGKGMLTDLQIYIVEFFFQIHFISNRKKEKIKTRQWRATMVQCALSFLNHYSPRAQDICIPLSEQYSTNLSLQ